MPFVKYEKWNPGAVTLEIVDHAAEICEEYAAQGYDITLRQAYYQFVARGLIPNTQRDYKRLGDILNSARLAGMLDWSHIVDRTRNLESNSHWDSPSSIMQSAAQSFALDKWADQPTRCECHVEKEALAGVIERAASAYDCAWFSCRGYVSQSEMWNTAQRLGKYIEDGQNVVILHLGDHDPSGIDMTRDIRQRLYTFITQDWLNKYSLELGGRAARGDINFHMCSHVAKKWAEKGIHDPTPHTALEVRRIALNFDQVEEYDPPANPAKLSDSRANEYIANYGTESWELDALDPATLNRLITDEIAGIVDSNRYSTIEEAQESQRRQLTVISDRWDDVARFLEGS